MPYVVSVVYACTRKAAEPFTAAVRNYLTTSSGCLYCRTDSNFFGFVVLWLTYASKQGTRMGLSVETFGILVVFRTVCGYGLRPASLSAGLALRSSCCGIAVLRVSQSSCCDAGPLTCAFCTYHAEEHP